MQSLYILVSNANDVQNFSFRLDWTPIERATMAADTCASCSCGTLSSGGSNGGVPTWGIDYPLTPEGSFCIEIPLDFGSEQAIAMTFSGGYLTIIDHSGARDFVRIMNNATILGGIGSAPPAYVLDAQPRVHTAGNVIHISEVAGYHFPADAAIVLRQDDLERPASHVAWIDDNHLEATIPTEVGDEGEWSVTVVAEGQEARLDGGIFLEGGGSGGGGTSLLAADVEFDVIAIIPDRNGQHEFRDAIAPLKEYRERQGHSMLVVDFDELAANFGPAADTTLVKSLLSYAWTEYRTMPQFVLLVGDAIDPQCPTIGQPNPSHPACAGNLLPAPQRGHRYNSLSPNGDFTFPYDDAYGLIDADQIADVVIARLPVRNASELSSYITKLRDYEGDTTECAGHPSSWTEQAAILVGDLTSSPENEWVRAGLPSVTSTIPTELEVQVVRASSYGDWSAAGRAAAVAAFNNGHVIIDAYGNTQPLELVYLLNFDCQSPSETQCFSVQELGNDCQYPLLLANTCIASDYDNWTHTSPPMPSAGRGSIAERFLFTHTHKGVVGVLGATHAVNFYDAHRLDIQFYDVLREASGISVGQMAWETKRRIIERYPSAIDIGRQAELLADPLLRLAWESPANSFRSTMEMSHTLPFQNAIMSALNIGEGAISRISTRDGMIVPVQGQRMLMLAAEDLSSTDSRLEFNGYDVDFTVTSNTKLSYWVMATETPNEHGHVGIDLLSPGPTGLKRMTAWIPTPIVDQFGASVNPSSHRVEPAGQWRHFYIDLSRMQGRVIKQVTFLYDDGPSEAGIVRAYFDAITVLSGPNELLDGGFEVDEDRDGHPDFWSGSALDDTRRIAYCHSGEHIEGDNVALIRDSVGGNSATQAITVASGAMRTVSFKARAEVPATLKVEVISREQSPTVLYSHSFNVTQSWQEYDASMTISGAEEFRDVLFSFVPLTTGVDYFVDDAKVVPTAAIDVKTPEAPSVTGLAQSVPNPMSDRSLIHYGIGETAHVTLKIYGATGRLVRVLLDSDAHRVGNWAVEWDGRNDNGDLVGQGVYFYELAVNEKRMQRKLLVIK